MSGLAGVVLFAVGLLAAIGLHEWGHFVTARAAGMRADRFFLGFGPTVWSTRRGETTYGVKLLPLGGFVRISGMTVGDQRQPPVAEAVFAEEAAAADRRRAADRDSCPLEHVPATPPATWQRLGEELERRGVTTERRRRLVALAADRAGLQATPGEAAAAFAQVAGEHLPDTGRVGDLRHRVLRGDDGRFFHDRPAWQRAGVLASGSAMHFVQALVLLFAAYWAFGIQPAPVVDQVLDGSPAAEAGLRAGDRIVAVNGKPVEEFAAVQDLISAHPGRSVTLTITEDDRPRHVRLTTALVVRRLAAGSLLAEAGLEPGDRVVAVNGRPVSRPEQLADMARGKQPREPVMVTVRRVASPQGQSGQVRVRLARSQLGQLAGQVRGLAGFVPAQHGLGLTAALRATFVGEGSLPSIVVQTVTAMGEVFGPQGIGQLPEQLAGGERRATGGTLASPVGLGQLVGQGVERAGAFFLLGILAALNVFVGVFNLFPLPPLDGGHLAVLGVEEGVNAVRRLRGDPPDYRVDPRTITAIAVPVIVLLGVVFASVLVLDITNPLDLPR